MLRTFCPIGIVALLSVLCSCDAAAPTELAGGFGFDDVRKMAAELSRQRYRAPAENLPPALKALDYDGYRSIEYRRSEAIRLDDSAFRLEFFHRGYLYPERVDINILKDGKPSPVNFRPELFKYAKGQPAGLTDKLGFAGFRILYWPDGPKSEHEIAAFLGASYFRATDVHGVYGTSARGIAVDTYVPNAQEEFPAFRSFWIEPPESKSKTLTAFALLDGPSLTGAYRFDIRPGEETIIDVRAILYPRKDIAKLGLAPLTSMFYYGESQILGPAVRNSRPQVHDADGLLIAGDGLWQWRPLHNPRQRRVSVFHMNQLQGFGLMQRDINPDDYLDTGALPWLRPSVWVEPRGQWGPGHVELLELPAANEGVDNIVAQFIADAPVRAGSEMKLDYRLRFFQCRRPMHEGLRTVATRRHLVAGGRMSYDVEFAGRIGDAKPQPVVTADGGTIQDCTIAPGSKAETWTLRFEVAPKEKSRPVEIRAYLHAGDETLSETWCDSWEP